MRGNNQNYAKLEVGEMTQETIEKYNIAKNI
jgi:hypothetical protein